MIFSAKPEITISSDSFIVVNDSKATIEINETGSFIINCTSTGEPRPEVEWDTSYLQALFDIIPLTGGKQLIVHNATEKDFGPIACKSSNAAGRAYKHVNVIVNGKCMY